VGAKKITNTYNQIVQLNPRITSDIYSLRCGCNYFTAQCQECEVHNCGK
jgi:hypothetical protein